MSRKKILFLIQDLNSAGAQHQLVSLSIGMSRRKHDCCIFTFSDKLSLLSRIEGENILFKNFPRKNKFDIRFFKELIKELNNENYDILHCTLDLAYIFGWLSLKISCKKTVFICSIHSHILHLKTIKQRILAALYVPILKKCDKLIFVCENQRTAWIKKFSIESWKSEVIYNGVSDKKFTKTKNTKNREIFRSILGISKRDLLFILVARFRNEKRHDLAIKAMEEAYITNKNIKILFIGDGPTYDHMIKKCNESLNPSMFVFMGSQNNVRDFLEVSDCFMLCSDAESFSIATLEAMAMDLPIISSDVGGQSEMVKTNVNGFLFEKGNVDELSKCIELIATQKIESKILGKNSRKILLDNFTEEKMFEKYDELFNGIKI